MSRSLEIVLRPARSQRPRGESASGRGCSEGRHREEPSTSRGKQSDARIGGLSDRPDPIADSEPGAAGSQVEKLGGLGRHSR
jgi:hypothetical protein